MKADIPNGETSGYKENIDDLSQLYNLSKEMIVNWVTK